MDYSVRKNLIHSSLVLLLLLTTLVIWGFSSPPGSAPDDDFHLVSMWCSTSNSNKYCDKDENNELILAPEALLKAKCYSDSTQEKVLCPNFLLNEISSSKIPTNRINSDLRYPGGFHNFFGLLVNENFSNSVYLVRIINSIIFSFLAAVIWAIATFRIKVGMTLLFTTFVPLGLFFIPSTNPTSWVLTGVTFSFIGTKVFIESEKFRKKIAFGVALIGLTIASFARWDGLIYSVMAVFIIISPSLFRIVTGSTIRKKILILLPLAVIVATATFVVISNRLLFPSWIFDSFVTRDFPHEIVRLYTNMTQISNLLFGNFGFSNLGWGEVLMPPIVRILGLIIVFLLLLISIRIVTKYETSVLSILLFIGVVVPLFYIQVRPDRDMSFFQPRYISPIVILFFSVIVFSKGNIYEKKTYKILLTLFTAAISSVISLATILSFYSDFIPKITNVTNYLEPIQAWVLLIIGSFASFSICISYIYFTMISKRYVPKHLAPRSSNYRQNLFEI